MYYTMTPDIRNTFKVLQAKGKLKDTVKYLSDILMTDNIDNMLAGFCYWNISDSYAMLRQSDNLYDNHLKFCKLLENMSEKYIFWVVCDATQRFTLELGGYGDFWWELYRNAVNADIDIAENERIVFEAHAAAMSVNPILKTTSSNLQSAKDCFSKFIKKQHSTECLDFYKLIYSALCLKCFGEEPYDILNLIGIFLPLLKEKNTDNFFATGEWGNLNGRRSKYNMAQVGINRAINAFIDTNKIIMARELYTTAIDNGLSANLYIEKRLKI